MLIVEGVSFSYKNRPVLRSLDLEVGEREMVGVVGPNGSGKTTLLWLITGVLRAEGGRILVSRSDIGALRASERARLVAIVPQDSALPDGFKALDLVLMGRNPHLKLLQWEGRRDLEIARRAMESTDTLHLAGRPLGALSGGERQRTVVATALAQEAPVLLLDEPTSSLDLSHQSGVMALVRRVQRQRGGAVLVAMHDLSLAAQYCDRLVMIAEGRAYTTGVPDEVLTEENISRVYGASVSVMRHPATGTPVVVPNPEQDAFEDVEPGPHGAAVDAG